MRKEAALANAAFSRLVKNGKGDSDREAIELYLIAGGEGIELTEEQTQKLERWTFADEMIRTNMGKLSRFEISRLIETRYNVSGYMARNYMNAAEAVFSSSSPINKKHRIQLRIEFLEKQSRKAADAKNFDAVASLEKSIAKYLEIYPEVQPDQSPKTIIYNILNTRVAEETLPTEEADYIIEEQLKQLPDAGE